MVASHADEVIKYDEDRLRKRLDRLPPEYLAVFSACSAQRGIPVLVANAPESVTSAARVAMNTLWTGLKAEGFRGVDLPALRQRLEEAVPVDADGLETCPVATSVLASVCYTIDCVMDPDVQHAAWSARSIYSLLDYLVQERDRIYPLDVESERRLLAHPVIQTELGRQERDLAHLENAAASGTRSGTVATERWRVCGTESCFL